MIGWGVNLNSVALMTNLILCIRFRIAHICYHYISMGLPIVQVAMSTVLGTIYKIIQIYQSQTETEDK